VTKRALCVGINYKGENQLQGCVNDMHDWTAEFNRRGFHSIVTLQDQFATRDAILKSLEHEIQQLTSSDLFVFTYSGHGSWIPDNHGDEPDGRDEALCSWDIMTAGVKGLIVDDELFKIFSKRHRGSRVVMISDSCHSGTVTRLLAPLDGASLERTPRFISPVKLLPARENGMLPANEYTTLKNLGAKSTKNAVRYAALLMSGCKDNEYSYDSVFHGRPNGAFTYVALQVLKRLPADATYLTWYKEIRKLLPSQSAPQRPMLDGEWAWKVNWKVFE